MQENRKENQKFIKNDQYFTVCVYTFILVILCTVVIKAIISFDQTRAFFGGLIRALGPFLIALLIAYILNPFVKVVSSFLTKLLKKTKVKRINEKVVLVVSMFIVYLIGLGLLITILIYVLPEVVRNLADLVNSIPTAYRSLLEWVGFLQERFPEVDFSSIITMLKDIQPDLTSSLKSMSGELIPVLYTASVSVAQWLANFLIALVVSVYMLYGKASLKRLVKIALCAFIPQKKLARTKDILKECNNIFSRYLVSKMIDSFIIGILCAVLMTILRIPYFGPFIGAIPGIIVILSVDPVKALIFAIMILALQQFDGLILGPKLLGNSTGMKPLWIIFAITLGGKFFGVPGMFLGVPVVATLGYLAELYMGHRLSKKGIALNDV